MNITRPSAFGEFVWIVLKMLMSTRKMVTSSVIRPGITSGFTRNEILQRIWIIDFDLVVSLHCLSDC